MKNKNLYIVSSLLVLSSCGFMEPDLKDYIKCGYVANQLQQDKALNEIVESMKSYANQENISMTHREFQKLSEEVQGDLKINAMPRQGKLNALLKVYNSSTCQSFHKQGIATPDMY